MEISKKNRARWLWSIVAVTAVYGVANVLIFYTTDSFGAAWFAASLFVYGILLASALALLLLDTGEDPVEVEIEAPVTLAETEPRPAPEPPERGTRGTELLSHKVLYEVPTGRVLQATTRTDGVERSLLFAITSDEVLSIHEIETRLDEVDVDPPPIDRIADVDAALERRRDRPHQPAVGDDGVAVEILDHEVRYEGPSGAVLEVTFRVGGTEHTELFVMTDDEVLPVPEGALDEPEEAPEFPSTPAGAQAPETDTATEAIER